mmetsp:Transcript_48408/g.113285  ORF Transcript_48408/g.113285 Transcript_48408/m.113285 type:complete len:84 (+) Transcript_48408:212-463(+)
MLVLRGASEHNLLGEGSSKGVGGVALPGELGDAVDKLQTESSPVHGASVASVLEESYRRQTFGGIVNLVLTGWEGLNILISRA